MIKLRSHRKIAVMVMVFLMIFQSVSLTFAAAAQPQKEKRFPGQPLPVELRTGELTLVSEDLKVGIDALPLAVTRIYRSGMEQKQPGIFGHKWHSFLDMEIAVKGKGLLSILDEMGRYREYAQQNDGSYVSARYDYEVITRNNDGSWLRRLKNGQDFSFDTSGKLMEVRDRTGRFLRISRMKEGIDTVIRVDDRYGRFIKLTCDASGQVLQMTDGAGRHYKYSYDSRQNLIGTTSQAGGTAMFDYDTEHRLTKVNLGDARSYFIEYRQGRISSQRTPLGTVATYDYSVKKNEATVKVTDSAGASTTYGFASNGLVTAALPSGAKETVRMNDRYLPVEAIGTNGGKVLVKYDAHDNVVWLNNNGDITEYTYTPDDMLVAVKSSTKGALKLTFDQHKNYTEIENSRGGLTSLRYNQLGQAVSLSSPTGESVKLEYDRYGHVNLVTAADGRRWKLDFTPIGLLRVLTLPTDVKINYLYDQLGQVVSINSSEGQKVLLIRDEWGQVIRMLDQSGHPYDFTYDEAGLLTAVRDPIGAVTRMAYDETGNIRSFTDAKGNTTNWQYDRSGLPTEERRASGGLISASFNREGQLLRQVNARGQRTAFDYDKSGRVTGLNANGDPASFTYDAFGRLVRMKGRDGDFQFKFEPDGLMQSVTDGITGVTVSYQYDTAGRRTAMVAGENQANYRYDSNGRISAIRSASGTVTFEYDAYGRQSAMNQPNGVRTTYAYDRLGRLTELRAVTKKGREVSRYRYAYDIQGNRISMTDGDHVVTRYEYDAVNRLVKVITGADITEYTYDTAGNRIAITENGQKKESVIGSDNRLLKSGNAVFSYDADGNMVSWTTEDGKKYGYAYDASSRLIEATGPDGTVRYRYAPNGARVSRQTGNDPASRYIFDQADMIAEIRDGKPAASFLFGYGVDRPLSMQRGKDETFYHADGLGSITRLTDRKGDVLSDYSYDAFGKQVRSESRMVNPFTYTAREWDGVANLYFYRARFYNPDIGRFLSHDPAGFPEGPNLYAYVDNNPINFTDPSGEFLNFVIGAGLGGLIGGGAELGSQVISNLMNKKDPFGEINWSTVGKGAVKGAVFGACPGLGFVTTVGLSGGFNALWNIGEQVLDKKPGPIDLGRVGLAAAEGMIEGGLNFGISHGLKKIPGNFLNQHPDYLGDKLPKGLSANKLNFIPKYLGNMGEADLVGIGSSWVNKGLSKTATYLTGNVLRVLGNKVSTAILTQGATHGLGWIGGKFTNIEGARVVVGTGAVSLGLAAVNAGLLGPEVAGIGAAKIQDAMVHYVVDNNGNGIPDILENLGGLIPHIWTPKAPPVPNVLAPKAPPVPYVPIPSSR